MHWQKGIKDQINNVCKLGCSSHPHAKLVAICSAKNHKNSDLVLFCFLFFFFVSGSLKVKKLRRSSRKCAETNSNNRRDKTLCCILSALYRGTCKHNIIYPLCVVNMFCCIDQSKLAMLLFLGGVTIYYNINYWISI